MTREEAIKILSERYSSALFSERTALETLIPELRESEDERIRKEINILYVDINSCITELLKARTDKDSEAEGKAIFKMEGLMVATLQDLSCIEDYLEKKKELGIQWLKSDNMKNPDKPYIDKAGMFYTTDGRMCYASEIGKQKESLRDFIDNFPYSAEQEEQKPMDLKKEIDKIASECTDGHYFDWDRFARHFYELGRKETANENRRI